MPRLEGVTPALLGEEKGEEEAEVEEASVAAAAARFVGVDLGDPMRTEGVLRLLPRVEDAGDPGEDGCIALSREGDGSTDALALDGEENSATRFAVGTPPPPPDLGEVGGSLEAAPRLTGVLRGETGGFLGGAEDPREVCLPGCGLMFLAATARRRVVAGRDRSNGDAREAPPSPPPPLEAVLPPPAASRACLMLLNCRLISAVWGFVSARRRRARGGRGLRAEERRGEGGKNRALQKKSRRRARRSVAQRTHRTYDAPLAPWNRVAQRHRLHNLFQEVPYLASCLLVGVRSER